jgi:Penicillinase repressor
LARAPSAGLTPLELDIMKVLWRSGPATVQTVQEQLHPRRMRAATATSAMSSASRNGVHEAEDRGVGSDAEAERHDGRERKGGALREYPEGVSQIVSERVHPSPPFLTKAMPRPGKTTRVPPAPSDGSRAAPSIFGAGTIGGSRNRRPNLAPACPRSEQNRQDRAGGDR